MSVRLRGAIAARIPSRAGCWRPQSEIEKQFAASREFAPTVRELPPIPHQYTAGQAAALAWLVRRGPAPLTFGATAEVSGPECVQRLTAWARELLSRPDDDLFPRPYVSGVEQVCRWVQWTTGIAPFPLPVDAGQPPEPTPRPAGLRRLP